MLLRRCYGLGLSGRTEYPVRSHAEQNIAHGFGRRSIARRHANPSQREETESTQFVTRWGPKRETNHFSLGCSPPSAPWWCAPRTHEEYCPGAQHLPYKVRVTRGVYAILYSGVVQRGLARRVAERRSTTQCDGLRAGRDAYPSKKKIQATGTPESSTPRPPPPHSSFLSLLLSYIIRLM